TLVASRARCSRWSQKNKRRGRRRPRPAAFPRLAPCRSASDQQHRFRTSVAVRVDELCDRDSTGEDVEHVAGPRAAPVADESVAVTVTAAVVIEPAVDASTEQVAQHIRSEAAVIATIAALEDHVFPAHAVPAIAIAYVAAAQVVALLAAPCTPVHGMALPVLTELRAILLAADARVVTSVTALVAVALIPIVPAITRSAVHPAVTLLAAACCARCTARLRKRLGRNRHQCAGRERYHEYLHYLPPAGGPLVQTLVHDPCAQVSCDNPHGCALSDRADRLR